MVAQPFEVGVVLHPVNIVVAERDGALQRLQGLLFPPDEGEAARQVVMGRGVLGPEAHELAVHLQAVRNPALLGIKPAEDLDDVGGAGIALVDGFEEAGFELDVVGGLCHGADSGGVVGATAGCPEGIAARADLQTLGHRRQAEPGRDRGAVPFHEGGVDLEDLVAIEADDLGLLGAVVADRRVILDVLADIDFAEKRPPCHDRQGAVDRGAGHRFVERAGVGQEFFGGEMIVPGEGGVENGQALARHAQTFVGEKGLEFFAGRLGAHSGNFPSRAGRVNRKQKRELDGGASAD